MNNLNPAQIQSVVTQLNIMISELYLLRQRVAQLEVENRDLASQLEQSKAKQGESPKSLEGDDHD